MNHNQLDLNHNRYNNYPFDLNRDIENICYDETSSIYSMEVLADIDENYLQDDFDKENIPVNVENTKNKTITNSKIDSLDKSDRLNLRGRSNQPAKKGNTPKYSRMIISVEKAASVQQNAMDKIQGISNDDTIKQHAFMRIQAFALTVVGLFGIANRSDGKEDRDMNITTKPAPLQVGKGSHSGKNKFHAAHDNATSGLHLEGFRESLIQEIANENKITPIKKRLLTAKQFTDENFDTILKNPDKANIRAIFDQVWPMDPKKPHTVFTGSQTDLNLNTTTEAGILVNLGIDKHIERYRDEICDLYLQITHAKISHEEACAQYCTIIKDCLAKLELDLENSLVQIDNYQVALLQLEDHKNMTNDQIHTILNDLHEKVKIIIPSKSKKSSDFHPKIPKNSKFLNSSLSYIEKDHSDPLYTFRNWMNKRWEELKNEISDQHKKLNAYLKYTQLESEGTEAPDFVWLFGEFNPETDKRELDEKSLSNAQENLWKPMSSVEPLQLKRPRTTQENFRPAKKNKTLQF